MSRRIADYSDPGTDPEHLFGRGGASWNNGAYGGLAVGPRKRVKFSCGPTENSLFFR